MRHEGGNLGEHLQSVGVKSAHGLGEVVGSLGRAEQVLDDLDVVHIDHGGEAAHHALVDGAVKYTVAHEDEPVVDLDSVGRAAAAELDDVFAARAGVGEACVVDDILAQGRVELEYLERESPALASNQALDGRVVQAED